MTRRQRITLAAALVALTAARAVADPAPTLTDFAHIHTPSHLTTDGGSKLDLPPGYFMSEPSFSKLDNEMKRLQDQETRQTAENKSLRASLDTWQPGWWTLAAAIVVGGSAGWYLHDKI